MLTVDRVEAMKVLTNKHSKVANVPIEMKNHFCSHIDPAISAQLIAGTKLPPHPRDSINLIPRDYYTNHKSHMLKEAREVARSIVDSHAHS